MEIKPLEPQSSAPVDPTKSTMTPDQKIHRLQGAATDFEGLLIHQMLQEMEKTLDKGSLVGAGLSGSIYSGMLTGAVSKSMAEHQSIGLADQVFQGVIRHEPELKKYLELHPEKNPCKPLAQRSANRGDLECLQPMFSKEVAPNTPKSFPLNFPPKAPETPSQADNIRKDTGRILNP